MTFLFSFGITMAEFDHCQFKWCRLTLVQYDMFESEGWNDFHFRVCNVFCLKWCRGTIKLTTEK